VKEEGGGREEGEEKLKRKKKNTPVIPKWKSRQTKEGNHPR
jgi:hypothetical protein